jgi:signal transduction histidine kinase
VDDEHASVTQNDTAGRTHPFAHRRGDTTTGKTPVTRLSVPAPSAYSGGVNLIRHVTAARTWKETAYLVADLFVGVIAFTVLVTGLSMGLALLITFFGLPILWAMLVLARGGARLERWRARALLDVDLPEPPNLPRETSLLRRLFAPLRDGTSWRAVAYFFLLFPLGIVTFTVAVTFWATALGLLTLPLWAWSLPHNGPQFGDTYYWNSWWQLGLASIAGAVLTLVTPWVIHGLAAVDRALVRALLGRTPQDERIEQLEETRARSVDAAVEERRRIERDLHDGAQQRLVAVGMSLGQALEKFGDDPETARTLVDDAHLEAQRAIAELRDLVRGFHPAVLEDRGLDAALSALAARAPFPVSVAVDVPSRPPASVEANAYFIVAEALTNAARHGAAHRASVDVRARDGRLRVEIADDGVGGADATLGTGLRGLADRAAAVDGSFSIDTPPGGGTRIVVELPCAS